MFGIKRKKEIQFREIGTTGVYISKTDADYYKSMKLLRRNVLRPMTYQEALVIIDRNTEIKKELKNLENNWFYMDGKGFKESGYYNFDEKGELTQGKGDIEKTVYIWKRKEPLSIKVLTDDVSRRYESRFELGSSDSPINIARIVIGIGHEMVIPKLSLSSGPEDRP